MKKVIYLCLFTVVFACNSNPQTENEKVSTISADETWKGFWTLLQQAVEANDKTAVKKLCSFEYGLDEKNFDETYLMFFNPAMKALILSTPSGDVRMEDPSASKAVLHTRVFNLYEEGEDEDGNTYESALMFYTGKLESSGKYRIYLFLAAG